MLPTPRLLGLALISPLLLALAGAVPELAVVAVLWLAGAAGLALLDARLSDPPEAFEIHRAHDRRLSLGADNAVRIAVRHRGRHAADLRLRDEPPDEWVSAPVVFAGRLRARSELAFDYTARPLRRGDYRFGAVTLRWTCPLGLMRRQHTRDLSAPVQVYPNLLEVRKYDLLLRTQRLRDLGLRATRRFGEGREFERLREYVPDDDFRHISWKATARRHKPITAQLESERSQTIFVAFDAGRMMSAPVGPMNRLDYVVNAALLFSYVVLGKGDRVGMMSFADGVTHYLEPRPGRAQFHRMLKVLYAVEAQPVEPDYRQALAYLKSRQRRRALVVVFTDLTGGASMQQLAAGVLALRPPHLPLVVTIADPALASLAARLPADEAGAFERAAAQRVLDDRRLTLQRLQQQGALTLDVPATQLSAAVINRYLEIKGRGAL
jgi:uncharacterized protein (DUF58 family)